jgi:hypothetical protein
MSPHAPALDLLSAVLMVLNMHLTVPSMHAEGLLWCRWAGLQRGAIAVALVYYYFDPFGMAEDSHRSTIIATTLILVLFSTVVFSAATKPLLEFMLGAGEPFQSYHVYMTLLCMLWSASINIALFGLRTTKEQRLETVLCTTANPIFNLCNKSGWSRIFWGLSTHLHCSIAKHLPSKQYHSNTCLAISAVILQQQGNCAACSSICLPVHVADLADDGTIRRRVSGRTRSGKLQHHPGQYNAAPLYTVVTMDPNDEVCH